GESHVAAGVGAEPISMQGDVYLTGPYRDAPFGLTIVTKATTGPLNLGRIVIRAQIDIDPQTAGLTNLTDRLPQVVLGVRVRIQRIGLVLDRPRFIVNPTSCQEQQIGARITSARAAEVGVSNRYALADCKALSFKPELLASTRAGTSLANGASL